MYKFDAPFALIEMSDRNGCNSYYSPSLTTKVVEKIDGVMLEKGISVLNTRIALVSPGEVQVLVASGEKVGEEELCRLEEGGQEFHVKLVFGDFQPFLAMVASYLEQAVQFAGNEQQKGFLTDYVEHFKSGDMDAHKRS